MKLELKTYLFTPEVDTKFTRVKYILDWVFKAIVFNSFNFLNYFQNLKMSISCILVDEAQFLTKLQVKELCHVYDKFVSRLCVGIRTDFQGKLFSGSKY